MWVRFEVVVEGWKGGGGVGVECFIHILKEIYRLDLQRAKGQVIKLGDYLTDFSFYLSLNLFFFLLLFKYSCLHFSLHHSLPPFPSYPYLPSSILPPFGFVHVSFIRVPSQPLHFSPTLSLSPLPSGYCQGVLYFNVSGCILLACLFVLLIRFHL